MLKTLCLKYFLHPLLAAMIAASSGVGTLDVSKLRVAIIEGSPGIEISGAHIRFGLDGKNWKVADTLKIKPSRSGVEVNGRSYSSPVRVSGNGGFIEVNGARYRGEIVVYKEGRGLLVVDELPLEFYLVGLINAESYSSWPRESIRAQAVVARTYALHRAMLNRDKLFDLRSNVLDQCYKGAHLEDEASADAVESTMGEVLYYNGQVALTFYHSTCGGSTASAAEVWGNDYPYLRSVECEWCVDSPRYFWSYQAEGDGVGEALKRIGIDVGKVEKIRVLGKTASGRNDMIKVHGDRGTKTINATSFRKAVGYTNIFSTRFDIFEVERGSFKFLGRGSGHGVGMCQWGARGMAVTGSTYREILGYYYRGCVVEKAY